MFSSNNMGISTKKQTIRQIDVITNCAVITKVVIKRVHYTVLFLLNAPGVAIYNRGYYLGP